VADVTARNGRSALVQTVAKILQWGKIVTPRGMETKELRHFSVEIVDPTDILCVGINANQSAEVIAAEALQLIGGFSDPAFSVKHAPKTEAFLNDDGEFDGAYGPRVEELIYDIGQRLSIDRDTRQAILPIWRAGDLTRKESKDYPCTLTLGFFIREEKLELDVTMRSNDVNWGFKNDIFVFSQLQLSIAHLLDLEGGPYRHTSYSMHLYAKDLEWANGLSSDPESINAAMTGQPLGIVGTSALDMQDRARSLALDETPRGDLTTTERWYREALGWADAKA
jgi:thymidylate synthase